MKADHRGFTLLELLIAVAIIGVVAAIAIPALNAAMERSRQKRSMAEIRALALAVSAYGTDFPTVPRLASATANQLSPYLTPTYLKHLPVEDGWRHPLQYQGEGLDYTILSLGSDGAFSGGPPRGPTTSYAEDIILFNGQFVQWPEGMQVR
jgi:type II secretion system protein G